MTGSNCTVQVQFPVLGGEGFLNLVDFRISSMMAEETHHGLGRFNIVYCLYLDVLCFVYLGVLSWEL